MEERPNERQQPEEERELQDRGVNSRQREPMRRADETAPNDELGMAAPGDSEPQTDFGEGGVGTGDSFVGMDRGVFEDRDQGQAAEVGGRPTQDTNPGDSVVSGEGDQNGSGYGVLNQQQNWLEPSGLAGAGGEAGEGHDRDSDVHRAIPDEVRLTGRQHRNRTTGTGGGVDGVGAATSDDDRGTPGGATGDVATYGRVSGLGTGGSTGASGTGVDVGLNEPSLGGRADVETSGDKHVDLKDVSGGKDFIPDEASEDRHDRDRD